MAAALIPTITSVGSAAYAAAPDLIRRVKRNAPGAYRKLKGLINNATPEQAAAQAAAQKNNVATNFLIGATVKAGVPLTLVGSVFPQLTPSDLQNLQAQFSDFLAVERKAADTQTVHVKSSLPESDTAAFREREIEAICNLTQFTSSQLAQLSSFFRNYGPAEIEEYQRDRVRAGKRPM